jgi:hypothetical protein
MVAVGGYLLTAMARIGGYLLAAMATVVGYLLTASVPDLDQDPPDPLVFGPPGSRSGSISQRYGSGSFCHQAKKVRKSLILFCDFFWTFYL